MNNIFYIDSPYLQHYGILGMKWGIRRYQNPDGTLTAAGRKRVKRAMKQHDIVMTTRDIHDRDKEYREFRRQVTNMYPAEVTDLMIKVEQAEQLKKMSDLKEEDKISKGLQYITSIADIVSKTATTIDTASKAAKNFQSMYEKSLTIDEKKKKNEKSALDTISDAVDLADKTIDTAKKAKETKESISDLVKKAKESRKESKIPTLKTTRFDWSEEAARQTADRVKATGAKTLIKDLQTSPHISLTSPSIPPDVTKMVGHTGENMSNTISPTPIYLSPTYLSDKILSSSYKSTGEIYKTEGERAVEEILNKYK